MKMYRQGDVLFREVKDIPKGPRAKRSTGHILEGEATGHIHRVLESQLSEADVLECKEGLYLSVTSKGVSIIHEEHGTLTLPAGNYEIVRQREYSPEEVRNVVD